MFTDVGQKLNSKFLKNLSRDFKWPNAHSKNGVYCREWIEGQQNLMQEEAIVGL